MSKTRKVKSRGRKQKKVKTRQRKTKQRKSNKLSLTKRIKLGLEIQKCLKPCRSLRKGSSKKIKCIQKHCNSVINKMVNLSLGKKN